jgi:hypothetical protein
MRVRRSTDNVEIDVSVNTVGQLTTNNGLLSTWLAGATGGVFTWIKQSFTEASVGAVGTKVWPGATSNVADSTVADQPEITGATPFPIFKGDAGIHVGIPGVLFKKLVKDFELPGEFTLRM